VDASGSKSGDAHIFHLTQADEAGHLNGGITVAVVTT
jgi:hypothetical protein